MIKHYWRGGGIKPKLAQLSDGTWRCSKHFTKYGTVFGYGDSWKSAYSNCEKNTYSHMRLVREAEDIRDAILRLPLKPCAKIVDMPESKPSLWSRIKEFFH